MKQRVVLSLFLFLCAVNTAQSMRMPFNMVKNFVYWTGLAGPFISLLVDSEIMNRTTKFPPADKKVQEFVRKEYEQYSGGKKFPEHVQIVFDKEDQISFASDLERVIVPITDEMLSSAKNIAVHNPHLNQETVDLWKGILHYEFYRLDKKDVLSKKVALLAAPFLVHTTLKSLGLPFRLITGKKYKNRLLSIPHKFILSFAGFCFFSKVQSAQADVSICRTAKDPNILKAHAKFFHQLDMQTKKELQKNDLLELFERHPILYEIFIGGFHPYYSARAECFKQAYEEKEKR